jgi:hypothetical protein
MKYEIIFKLTKLNGNSLVIGGSSPFCVNYKPYKWAVPTTMALDEGLNKLYAFDSFKSAKEFDSRHILIAVGENVTDRLPMKYGISLLSYSLTRDISPAPWPKGTVAADEIMVTDLDPTLPWRLAYKVVGKTYTKKQYFSLLAPQNAQCIYRIGEKTEIPSFLKTAGYYPFLFDSYADAVHFSYIGDHILLCAVTDICELPKRLSLDKLNDGDFREPVELPWPNGTIMAKTVVPLCEV